MDTQTILIIVTIIVLVVFIAFRRPKPKQPEEQKNQPSENKTYNYEKRTYLLTVNENIFYRELLPIAQKLQLTICPKVRLADIVKPCKGQNWQAAFNKIQSKHIDFILCNNALQPILAIELDDNSHERQDRKERDAFVDSVLNMANIPIIHTRGAKGIEEKIKKHL